MSSESFFSKPFNFDRTVRVAGTIIIIIGLLLLIGSLSGVLLPFFAAWLIAYMLNPFVDFLQNKIRLRNRAVCVIFTIVLLIGVLVAGGTLFAKSATTEVRMVEDLTEQYLTSGTEYNISPETKVFASRVLESVVKHKEEIVQKLLPTAYTLLSSSFEYLAKLFVVFIMFLYIFFILMDFDTMKDSAEELVPKQYRKVTHMVFHDLATGMDIYFRKQALISAIVGCLFAIGFSIIGLPMGISMGLLVGLLNMVPYMHTLGMIPPIFVALVQSARTDQSFWITVLWIVVTFCIIQLIIDLVLTPKIMGKATGLKPAVILLALSVWGSLLGVLGMIIALPVTTMISSYYKHFIIERKRSDELIAKNEEKRRAK